MVRIMKDNFMLLLSGLLFIAILSPILTIYATSLVLYVVVVNPLTHVYRIFRHGIQYDPHEAV